MLKRINKEWLRYIVICIVFFAISGYGVHLEIKEEKIWKGGFRFDLWFYHYSKVIKREIDKLPEWEYWADEFKKIELEASRKREILFEKLMKEKLKK